ncbi:MAG TPA: GAF domain-containing protein [Candidatus Dormibacteraeota bacterium]|nr:GAF domain-containing protein [Candidatus Dormibacteraeota bacterium]
MASPIFPISRAEEILKRIRSIVTGREERIERAKQLAEAVGSFGNYRWTGVYDVGKEMVSIIAYSTGAHTGTSGGPGAPAYPTFPITKGLTAAAIRQKSTIVVGDVRTDPRYLTAFGNTLSELIVPVIDPQNGTVVGTIDVESERANAFSAEDQRLLEECAKAALPLWILR